AACANLRPPFALDAPAGRPRQPRDGPQDSRLPCAGRPDERDRLRADRERYLDVEAANRDGAIEPCRAHENTLSETRMAAPTSTNSALIASATSKSWSSCA